jgi:RNA-directed DNA polymerase
MREPYTKGLATHGDPESCVDAREGMGEALTGAHAGRVLSFEKVADRGADAMLLSGRQHRAHRDRERCTGPRVVVDPAHAWKLPTQELGDPVADLGRWHRGPRRESQGNATAMHGHGKSDRPIVPKKPVNKGCGAPRPAERAEVRGLAKGNPRRQNRFRTQDRTRSEYGQP